MNPTPGEAGAAAAETARLVGAARAFLATPDDG